MASAKFARRPPSFASISYTLSQHEQFEMADLKTKRIQSHDSLSRQCNSEVDWSMRTIDRSESAEEYDATRLQTVSLHFRELGHFNIPYHARQIDELREVLYFHPFTLPKSVPPETFLVEEQDSVSGMVVVVVEDRDGHFRAKLANMTHTIRKKMIRFGHLLKSFVMRND